MKQVKNEIKLPEHTCCICGKKFRGWGNNPVPVKQEGRCCDDCNITYVVAERIARIYKRK